MTHKQIGEYIKAQTNRQENDFKEQAILLYGLFRQWAATQTKNPRTITLKELYPSFFKEKKKDISQKEAAFLSMQRWRSFLGV